LPLCRCEGGAEESPRVHRLRVDGLKSVDLTLPFDRHADAEFPRSSWPAGLMKTVAFFVDEMMRRHPGDHRLGALTCC